MSKIASICLTVSFLATAGVSAQGPQGTNRAEHAADAELRLVSNRLLHTGLLTQRLALAEPVLIGWNSQTEQPIAPKTSHAGRTGALIGLAAGAAAAGLYWANSNCRYGSDSASAIVSHCVAPSAAMVVGGWLVGRAIGRGKEHKESRPNVTPPRAYRRARCNVVGRDLLRPQRVSPMLAPELYR